MHRRAAWHPAAQLRPDRLTLLRHSVTQCPAIFGGAFFLLYGHCRYMESLRNDPTYSVVTTMERRRSLTRIVGKSKLLTIRFA